MKPAAFDYVRAESLEEALSVLAEVGPDARILAGGQSLGPMLNLRLAQPEVVIDIARTPGLKRLEWADDGLMLTAATTQASLLADAALGQNQPLLAEAMPWIGHVPTRARGTVCGSLAHADPAAELPLLFATIGGTAIACSASGQRGIESADFFQGMFDTAIQDDEMLLAVRFEAPKAGSGSAFAEVAERHGDFAILAAASVADADGVTLGLGGIGDTPLVYRWDGLEAPEVEAAVNALADTLEPRGDPRADGEYRRRLVRTVGQQTVFRAMERRHAV
ncbi:MAG: FAD binding domain-containing protein [Alphaproteobacteria bacterium]